MQKEIRQVDKEKGIVRITIVSERWYARSVNDPTTGLPSWEYVPSVTWLCDFYPKSTAFYKWLANTGWSESQALKEAAGDKGSKIHAAVARLLAGDTIKMDEAIINPSTGQPEPLTLEEYQALMSFVAWHTATKPVLVSADQVVWNDADEYAGSVDFACTIDGQLYVVDFKTSKAIWPGHRMQVSAYKHAVPEWKDAKLAILQLGYAKNRMGYKFTEVDDCYELFLSVKKIWSEETKGVSPLQRDYPLSLTLKSKETNDISTGEKSEQSSTSRMETVTGNSRPNETTIKTQRGSPTTPNGNPTQRNNKNENVVSASGPQSI